MKSDVPQKRKEGVETDIDEVEVVAIVGAEVTEGEEIGDHLALIRNPALTLRRAKDGHMTSMRPENIKSQIKGEVHIIILHEMESKDIKAEEIDEVIVVKEDLEIAAMAETTLEIEETIDNSPTKVEQCVDGKTMTMKLQTRRYSREQVSLRSILTRRSRGETIAESRFRNEPRGFPVKSEPGSQDLTGATTLKSAMKQTKRSGSTTSSLSKKIEMIRVIGQTIETTGVEISEQLIML